MKIAMYPILKDGSIQDISAENEYLKDIISHTLQLYTKVGFVMPWISYVALHQNTVVGAGAFKSPPVNGRVEIAYFTFPPFENKGIGTEIAKALIRISKKNDPNIVVFAQTLPEKNASARLLEKLHFKKIKELVHPEDGKVWEWELTK